MSTDDCPLIQAAIDMSKVMKRSCLSHAGHTEMPMGGSCLHEMKLVEYQNSIDTMSYKQLKTELSTLETLMTQVIQSTQRDTRKKQRFDLLKETLEVPTDPTVNGSRKTFEAMESCYPHLETLRSLGKKSRLAVHIKILDEICTEWPQHTAIHAKILDEIADGNGAKAIASHARELAIESLIESRQLTADQVQKARVQEKAQSAKPQLNFQQAEFEIAMGKRFRKGSISKGSNSCPA
jgi:hypothetical protein